MVVTDRPSYNAAVLRGRTWTSGTYDKYLGCQSYEA